MNKIRTGHFLGDGGDVYLPIGFIPDYFRMADIDHGLTNVKVEIHEWFERMEDHEASNSQEGWGFGMATVGYVTLHEDGAGISAYDTGSQLPAAGYDAGELAEWKASTPVDVRTATKAGTYTKPTVGAVDDTGGVCDRDAIFENVGASDSSTDTSEPVWPSRIGGQVTDSAVVWEKVNAPKYRGGYQGVCVRLEIADDSHECYYLAIQADDSVDHGDVDGWPNGIDPNWS